MAIATLPTRIVVYLGSMTLALAGLGCGAVDGIPFLDSAIAGLLAPASEGCDIPDDHDDLVAEILRLVNEERAKTGAGPVVLEPLLAHAASGYACTMIQEDFFGHYHPTTGEGPGERISDVGYSYRAVGENLAAGQRTPDEVVRDWMNSTQGHRENLLNPLWSHMGMAIRNGGTYGIYWVQEFGAPWRSIPLGS